MKRVLLAVLTLAAAAVAAQSFPKPPEEAFKACQDKEAGAACTVSLMGREMKGTCSALPGEKRLACKPEGMPTPP
jgi:hypothetical protein